MCFAVRFGALDRVVSDVHVEQVEIVDMIVIWSEHSVVVASFEAGAFDDHGSVLAGAFDGVGFGGCHGRFASAKSDGAKMLFVGCLTAVIDEADGVGTNVLALTDVFVALACVPFFEAAVFSDIAFGTERHPTGDTACICWMLAGVKVLESAFEFVFVNGVSDDVGSDEFVSQWGVRDMFFEEAKCVHGTLAVSCEKEGFVFVPFAQKHPKGPNDILVGKCEGLFPIGFELEGKTEGCLSVSRGVNVAAAVECAGLVLHHGTIDAGFGFGCATQRGIPGCVAEVCGGMDKEDVGFVASRSQGCAFGMVVCKIFCVWEGGP